jgi:serine/threonine protein kinase
MGDVYLALDARLDRQVAIKVVRGEVHDQEALDRFFREARAAAALRHPNIVTIYASGQHDHQPYMVMEFVDGESLSELIRQRRNLMLSDKLSYVEQICAGLHYAHLAGIVHRDIKPANIMVDRQGVVRILDFGIARIEGSAMTLDGTMVGSLNYMSPEQMLGRPVDHRSDMFSLGSVAYELLCYQRAFKGGVNDGLLHRLPHEDPPRLRTIREDLPEELEEVIERALQKDPDRRYPDLELMRNAILKVTMDLDQDDVRTIVVRPRARATTETPVVTQPGPDPTSGVDTSESDPVWRGYGSDVPAMEAGQPAWAAPLPTRVVRAPADTLSITPAPRPLRTPSSVSMKTPTSASMKIPTSVSMKAPTSVTTRSRLATPTPGRPVERTSAARGILVGSILGTSLLAALAASAWKAAPPATALEREAPAINSALAQYRVAYRTRDIEAMTAVFPDIPPSVDQAMRRTFDRCLVYEVTYDGISVEMDPADDTLARADVRSSHVCTPKSGDRETTTDHHDVLSLRKRGDAWFVTKTARVSTSEAP